MDFGRPNSDIGRKMANSQLLFLALAGFGKASFYTQKLNSLLLHMITTLKIYPCIVSLLSNVNRSALLEGILLSLFASKCPLAINKAAANTRRLSS